jgi:hypothetical protein
VRVEVIDSSKDALQIRTFGGDRRDLRIARFSFSS